jgi:signal recognition particle-docking protein FtsY
MGLINWLKQKIFHKKDEDKKEGKPVEPVEENLKSEEAKDKTSGESVVEKTLEGNKVDEEPIFEVKKEEIKEESLQPEVVKKEQSVEQSIEDKVETKEEPIVEENTLDESVQPEIKEEQKIEEQPVEENKVEDNSSIKDEEKYEPSKENKQPSFEEPVIQNNTDGIENNNEFEYSNPLLDLVLEDKLEKKESKVEVNDEQPIEDKAETKEEPIVEKELSDEPVQPEIKEEQHAEENKTEEKENEEDEDEVIEEKEEQTKEAEQVNSTDEPVIEKKNDEATTKKVEVDHETKIYNLGLAKSREGFGARLNSIANKYKEANSDYFDELERCLIEADVGVNLTMSVLDETEKMSASQHLDNPKEINDLLVDNLFMNYAKSGDSFQTEIKFDPENPTVLLMVGVNGTGKTTTIAKLAKHYKELGKKVLLVAADTFRAGAVQQLSIWANRIGVDIFERGQGADPASVCFDAVKKAINDKYDLVMVDTAGRLHTKDYLMAELGKVNRVIKKVLPVAPQEIWLALDANTGQNGVQQAKVFKEVTPLTGVVITKMDGTSKGGIILAIRDQLGVPVRFIGLGEHEDDLREFDLDRYLYALLVGEDENFED